MAALTIDFFHDVVCCWCFNISARWGTPAQARETILGHWSVCRDVIDRPDLIDVEAMRAARLDYPHGFEATRQPAARPQRTPGSAF